MARISDRPSVYSPAIYALTLIVKYDLDVTDPSQAKAIQRIADLLKSILPEPTCIDLESLSLE